MDMQPQTKEEKLRDLFQIMQSNIFLLAEIKDVLERTTDAAVKILNEKGK